MIPRSLAPYLWMLTGSFSFAVMSILTHSLRGSCDWQLIALARSLTALVCTGLFACAAGVPLWFRWPKTLWLRSFAGSISMGCSFFALTRLPVSDVLTLTNMFPIWIGILSWPLIGEAPSLRTWIAVIAAVAGVVLIEQPRFKDGNFASLVALAGSLFTAVALLGLHRLQYLDTRAIVVHFSAVASLAALAMFALFDRLPTSTPPEAGTIWSVLLGVGLCATLGQYGLTRAFSSGSPTKVAVVGLTQIVFAMLFEIALGEWAFDAARLVGMGLVVAPTAWLMTHREAVGD